ncbi:MAG TPA: YbaY family lipoprotein [Candidatus Acidoferrum sp.]|nr:YbaY family lipoprotein [Candidatus Acidoferrum sp.]
MLMPAYSLASVAIAVAGLSLPALSGGAQQSSPAQAPTTAAPQSVQQTPAPPPHPISRSPLRFALPRREYLCAGGARIVILLETKAARLTLNGHIYDMKQLETASGTKYAEGSVVWSSTGEDGFLVDSADSSHPKMLAEECHLQSSYPPAAPAAGSIQGTATFGSHPTLPSDSVLIVQLRDLTRDADDPAAVLAEERIPIGGRAAPIPFTLKFDTSKATAKTPFAISASITGHGKLLFVLVKAVTIPDIANPAPVHLALSRASSKAGQTEPPAVPEAPPHL